MTNERLTEAIVRDHFKEDALYKSIKWEEQKSSNRIIAQLLVGQSKSGKKGNGAPEFLISFPTDSRYLIIVECKAKPSFHESEKRNKIKDYAVDGVLHYAKALSATFDVLAIAVSGETTEELLVSHFLWKKEATIYEELCEDKRLLSIDSYLHLFANEQFADNLRNVDIVSKAIELNEDYNNYSIPEQTRNTMVSAMLLSLIHTPFRLGYKAQPTTKSLSDSMMAAIKTTLEQCSVRNGDAMVGEFSKLLNEPLFRETKIKNKKSKKEKDTLDVIKEMIEYLHKNVYPLVSMEHSGFDVLGRFYTEFIRYAGSEQKQGLVLTPFHITDLFCDLANLTEHDILYDPCCGTGGFLIAGMKRMFQKAGNNEDLKMKIRTNQLVGVELRPSMYTYACSNMMLRGDGRSNIYCGDCYQTKDEVSAHKPTVAFLNPPYDVGTADQLRFIGHALDVVSPQNGRVVAIVQMSCAIKDENDLKAVKKQLLSKHHLKAVLSMPDDLFYPVGVVTCIMVWEANKPNVGKKTWFGYFKNDGFEKRKHQGRIDARGKFKSVIKEKWISAYQNSEEIAGLSVKHEVKFDDEWCAEAYMQTDYSIISKDLFERKIRHLFAHNILCNNVKSKAKIGQSLISVEEDMITDRWKWFRYDEVFDIKKGFYNKKPEESGTGNIPFIGATESNNGITSMHTIEEIEAASKTGDNPNQDISEKIFSGNCITVSNNGSIGFAFYQEEEFTCSHDVNPLYLKGYVLNRYIAMFLCTLIELEQYRWAYGRKWRPKRMPSSLIKLPVKADGIPNWEFMENYIKSLPYSANI